MARGLSNRAPRSSLFRRDPPRKILTTAATSYKRTNRFLSPIIEAILFDDDIPPPPTIFEIADPSYLLSDNFPLLLVSFYSEDEEFLSLNFSRGNDSIHPARSSNSRQEGGRGCRGGGCTSLAQLPDSAPPRVIVEAHPPSIHPSRWNYCV